MKFCPAVSCNQHVSVFPRYCHIGTFFVLKNSRVFGSSSDSFQFLLCAPSALITSGINLTGLYYHVGHISYFESQCLSILSCLFL